MSFGKEIGGSPEIMLAVQRVQSPSGHMYSDRYHLTLAPAHDSD